MTIPATFGFLVFPQLEELDFVGPWEMVTMWKLVANGPDQCVVVAENMQPVVCAKGLSINPQTSFADCPPLDVLLIPGGMGTRTQVANAELLKFVRQQAQHCQTVMSVCTGSFILQAAGLLAGKRATTHWGSLDRLRQLPGIQVVEERFVQDGAVWSSAGVSAGIDMTLAYIAQTAGEEAASKVQFAAEYYPSPRRYGDVTGHAQAPGYIKLV